MLDIAFVALLVISTPILGVTSARCTAMRRRQAIGYFSPWSGWSTGTDRYRRRVVRAEAELDMQRSRSAWVLQ